MEDPLISYRQPIVTASGLLLAFTLGFAGQWVQRPNPLGAWADYLVGALILAGSTMLILSMFRILNANYPRHKPGKHYARTLHLFIAGISLNFIGLFGDLLTTFLYTCTRGRAEPRPLIKAMRLIAQMPPRRRKLALLASALASLALAGCQPAPVRLMPTPVPFVDGYIDPFAEAGAELEGTEAPVFYTTNRAILTERPEPVHLALPSDSLRMGVAHVRVGDEALDWAALHRLSTSPELTDRPVVRLESLEQMAVLSADQLVAESPEARAFFELVNRALAESPSPNLLVYLHGSNNTVQRASAQAGQFRHFTGRRTVVIAFMWPSAGSLMRYLTDVANAASTIDRFARFLELLAEYTEAPAIDILAYSAGAQILSPALARLGTPRPGESRAELRERLRLGQVYFAAPDIDTRRFVDDVKTYIDLTERVSLSANLNDSVLRLASLVARRSRAGRPDVGELNDEQTAFLVQASNELQFDLISVDPEDIPNLPSRSHAFWYESPWVSGDLLVQFLLRLPPVERGLEAETTPKGGRYWSFPDDYDERVVRIIRKAIGRDAEVPSATP